MKVYYKLVLDRDGTVLEENSYEHTGEVILCKGGGSSETNTVDYAFNRRMASIYEEQQDFAREFMNFWRTEQKGLDIAKIDAQKELLPHQQAYDTAKLKADTDLIPFQTENAKVKLSSENELIPALTKERLTVLEQNAPVREQFLAQAAKGVNINDRMGQATADVARSFKDAGMQTQRGLSRMGVTASAGATASNLNATNLARAKANAGARGLSRVNAEKETFERLNAGASYGLAATNGGGV